MYFATARKIFTRNKGIKSYNRFFTKGDFSWFYGLTKNVLE